MNEATLGVTILQSSSSLFALRAIVLLSKQNKKSISCGYVLLIASKPITQ